MSASLLIVIIVHVSSLIFGLFTLWRLYEYIRRFRFDESKYTLLLGFIHLHWITIGYFVFGGIWALVSLFFFITISR